MLPLSRDLPKPLMPLWGVPILERILNLLKRWGVKEVVINLHHNPDEIFALGRSLARPDLKINFSFEPEILGTGGALRHAEWFVGDQPFWLINSDIAADLKPDALLKAFKSGKCIAAAWLHPILGPRTVEMSKGWITAFQSRTPGAKGTFTFCGLHLVSPRILEFLPESGFAGIIPAYERAMKQGLRVAGVCVPGSTWADVGTPRQYLDAHRQMRKTRGAFAAPRAECPRHEASGRGVIRERNVRVENSVIWDGAILRAGSVIENAIVGRGADVSGHVRHIAMRADLALDPVEQEALQTLGMNSQHATAYPMGPRGSDRMFTRVASTGGNVWRPLSERTSGKAARRAAATPPPSVILMRYSLKREENGLYCEHARRLRTIGLPVPRVLLDRPELQLAIIEDLGDISLQDWIVGKPPAAVRGMYEQVLDAVLVLHEKGTARARAARWNLMPPFDEKLYRWERDWFAGQFLQKHLRLPSRQIAEVNKDLARAAARLLKTPRTLIHRDLQSSNIFLKSNRPFFIDFQGMRFGAAAYDLASLLCDPYVSLPETIQEELLDYCASRGADPGATTEEFWWAAIERLAQALGAYARLGAIPGMQSFTQHIAPAVAMMNRALNHVGGLHSLRSLMGGLPDA
jgi:NDP-sugar pyrophosphorylase family protein/aminoglycoside/choline kinase family phosphotransferase